MKIAWFKRVISPEIGADLAGYNAEDPSFFKRDDLYMTGLCVDDGENKILLMSFDLIGLDESFIRKIRAACAAILGTEDCAVLLSCTHTHSGPHTRAMAKAPQALHTKYLEELENAIIEEVRGLKDYRECSVYFYSSKCDENHNRRYVTGDNVASFTPFRHEVVPLVQEYADQELGQLCFIDSETNLPIYVIGNYAAHPLVGHCIGFGGKSISADYPGAFREYLTQETGAECMFISGAAGNLVPKEDEIGGGAVKRLGINLAKAVIGGLIDCTRNPGRFCLKDAKVGAKSGFTTLTLRKRKIGTTPAHYSGSEVTCEMQVVAIGDVCFVGVPGELCCEVGQEIKWHSPFRRCFIAYNSTAYLSYLGHTGLLIGGGYEGNAQWFSRDTGLKLLNAAADAMFQLHDELLPCEGDIYPDCVVNSLVNIPPNR